jgi:hypothetical protein
MTFSSAEAFDIILMTHPSSVAKLPRACRPLPPDFDPRRAGPGQCLYRELLGIAERDHRYDDYLNSQECLVNEPAAAFLQHYKLLLRADLGKRQQCYGSEFSSSFRIRILLSKSYGSDPNYLLFLLNYNFKVF